MSGEVVLTLWLVTWRERSRTSAWRIGEDGKYKINKPVKLSDESGEYWQVAVYAFNRMTAIFDAAEIINKEIKFANSQ